MEISAQRLQILPTRLRERSVARVDDVKKAGSAAAHGIAPAATITLMNNCLALVIALSVMCSISASAQTPSDDAGVRAAINQYFKGHATADPNEMRKPFLPTAHIEGNRDGKFVSWTVDQYVANFNGKPAADESTRKRTIDRVEISGDAAMVSATLVHSATTFTDYFVLLKVSGEWKISNKVYTRRPTK